MRAANEARQSRNRLELEDNFAAFVEAAWPSIDPSPFHRSWAIDALCEHLEAVTRGQIRHLLVNFPPRCSKTLVTSVCYPAWVWAQRQIGYLCGPKVRFLCGSYGAGLAITNSSLFLRLLQSEWYRELWGGRFKLTRESQHWIENDLHGQLRAVSTGGVLIGLGGDIIILDDPHNTESVESEAEREATLRWWRELSNTRLNDSSRTPLIVIMQRLHENDVSGAILEAEARKAASQWTHLMIPMEYDPSRHCVTGLGWEDPRGLDANNEPLSENDKESRRGELMWPERFPAEKIRDMKADLGPYMASGRLQQMPVPEKGEIFRREWWQPWEGNLAADGTPDGKWPSTLNFIVASLDGAYTEKEENDPSAFTVWGVFTQQSPTLITQGYEFTPPSAKRIILIHAWRKFLPFSGPRMERGRTETLAAYKYRTSEHWGLMEWVAHDLEWIRGRIGIPVSTLLIEAKASGMCAADELANRYRSELQYTSVIRVPVKGDKVARALAVQPIFSGGMVFKPMRANGDDWDWAKLVEDEMAVFPKGRHDDLTDSATQALRYLRDTGLALTDQENARDFIGTVMHRPKLKALYPV